MPQPPDAIAVPCFCRGQNAGCTKCAGTGEVMKPACRRCNGRGELYGKKCLDCRGEGWRAMDVAGWDDRGV